MDRWPKLLRLSSTFQQLQYCDWGCTLVDGKYHYEIEVLTMGETPQFGWATKGFERMEGHSGNGVGDDTCSWGFDGHRIMKWNGEGEPFGKVWVAGDVLGPAIDLMGKSMSYSVNCDFC